MAEGSDFDLIPGGKAKAWDEDEIEEFLDKRKAERDRGAANGKRGER